MKLFPGYCLLVTLLLVACSGSAQPETAIPNPAVPTVIQPVSATPEIAITQGPTASPEMTAETEPPEQTPCPGDEVVNPIGQSIADEFVSADYTEVMGWFCDGAAFEDIVVALQTEELTGAPADEMLQMAAEGYSWEEIWFIVGLDE